MKDQSKTRQVLIQELSLLRQKIAELEQSESEGRKPKKKSVHSTICPNLTTP